MAERPLDAIERPAAIASIARAQTILRQTFALGTVPVDEEVRMRAKIADLLMETSAQLSQQQYLYDAIEHLETILRRVPQDHPDVSMHLNTLSFAKMSEYIVAGSRHALDKAVLYGSQAKDLTTSMGLVEHHPEMYLRILNNLGFALSRRNALVESSEDLEEAVVCAREIYGIAPKSSELYQLNLNNLASRLRVRYNRGENPNDINEAMALVKELMSRTKLGTIQHSTAVGQLGVITSDKFKRTDSLQDLDEALGHCKTGLEALPQRHETRVDMLRQIVDLYSARHHKTSDIADLANTVHYSELLFKATPSGHTARGQYLLEHLQFLQKYAFAVNSLPMFESTIDQIQTIFLAMPSDYPQQQQCQSILANLLGKRYILSNNLQELASLIDYTKKIFSENNNKFKGTGSSKPLLETGWLWNLTEHLRRLVTAPAENSVRNLGEQELLRTFHSCYKVQNDAVRGLVQLYQKYGIRLQVLAEAIKAGRTLSDDELIVEMTRLKDEKAAATKKRQQRSRYRPPEYETELGLRQLAVDPETKAFVMDLRGLLEAVLGYDVTKPVSQEEFDAREARLEQDFINKAHLEGRHPNLNLCYSCRDLTKPLKATAEGFELTAKSSCFPFGNFSQLKRRKNCSICRLILSIITAKSGRLHPRLNAIDREVQGTRLSTAKLSTGETLMRVDYGIRHVGELRILTPRNYRQALRQAWEADAQSRLSTVLADRAGFVYDKGGQQVNLGLIKSWLNDCDHNHGSACNHPRSGIRVEMKIFLTFIDVVQECLVTATSFEKYFALSYVWGDVEMSKTLRSNYNERQQHWALSATSLPKTVKDAMKLVRSLGERFLWVDAICIVQDDEEQMAMHIPNMDIVYGKAFATIVALHGDDADAGLPGVTPGTRAPQQIEIITVSNKSLDLDHDPQCEKNEIIGLVATPRPLHLALEVSKWNSRGWILQERLLSLRCLYFSPDAVYFQCSRETLSEGGTNEEFKAHIFDEIGLEDQNILRNANHDNPFTDLHSMYDVSPHERLCKAFQTYKKLIETYSRRNFSFKSDIINAFTGMFAVMDEHFQDSTFHGIPAAIFSHALLWTPAARLARRGAQLPLMSAMSMGQPDPKFPSWSWVGWDGPVEYRLFEEADGNVLLPTAMVRLYKIGSRSSSQVKEVKECTKGHPRIRVTDETVLISDDCTVCELSAKDQDQGDAKNTDESAHRKHNSSGSDMLKLNTENPSETGSVDSQNLSSTNRGDKSKRGEAGSGQEVAKLIPDRDRGSTWLVLPPQPPEKRDPPLATNTLWFTAPTVPLTAFQITSRKHYLSLQSHVHAQGPQAVRRIHDRNSKHCGLWWEQAGYGYVGQGMSPDAESKIIMLGISAYGDAYHPRKGPYRVEGEIRVFDDDVFPAVGSGSGLVNVLVVDLDMGHPDGIGDRCTVAVIHIKAWEAAGPLDREVRLA
jgi:Heterokaryon incompatibility protein (HET)/Tetratricopeptide repeat